MTSCEKFEGEECKCVYHEMEEVRFCNQCECHEKKQGEEVCGNCKNVNCICKDLKETAFEKKQGCGKLISKREKMYPNRDDMNDWGISSGYICKEERLCPECQNDSPPREVLEDKEPEDKEYNPERNPPKSDGSFDLSDTLKFDVYDARSFSPEVRVITQKTFEKNVKEFIKRLKDKLVINIMENTMDTGEDLLTFKRKDIDKLAGEKLK